MPERKTIYNKSTDFSIDLRYNLSLPAYYTPVLSQLFIYNIAFYFL